MANRLLALSSAALTLLMISAASNPADARKGGHSSSGAKGNFGGYSGPKTYSGGYGGSKTYSGGYKAGTYSPGHRHRRFHRHIIIGAPFVYGAYDYGYGDCYWLRRRAIYTGSPYWWNRYHACVYGYGY